jgi:hypothetical protein
VAAWIRSQVKSCGICGRRSVSVGRVSSVLYSPDTESIVKQRTYNNHTDTPMLKYGPLPGNGSINTYRGEGYATNNSETVGSDVFYAVRPVAIQRGPSGVSRVEEGSNTSTVALRVVGGAEKGTQCLGV